MHFMSPPLQALIGLIFGLLLGSFYNVCIHRYLTKQSLVLPPSHCPKCSKKLSILELIPVFSWLFLRGKCKGCGQPISIMYPLVELTSGLWAAAMALNHGVFTPAWVGTMAVGAVFIIASGIDLRALLLPDKFTLPGALLAFGVSTLTLDLPWQDAAIGALAGCGTFWILQHGYRLLRGREGLGGGDVKLMAMIGALVGWQALPMVILAAAISALVPGILLTIFANKEDGPPLVPFGPFLSFGAMLHLAVDLTAVLQQMGPR